MPLPKLIDRLHSLGVGDDLRTMRDVLSRAWEQIVRWQDTVTDWVRASEASPLWPARTVGATIAASATTVYHGLGRVPSGWVVASPSASATVWQAGTSTTQTLTLQASAPVTVILVVF